MNQLSILQIIEVDIKLFHDFMKNLIVDEFD